MESTLNGEKNPFYNTPKSMQQSSESTADRVSDIAHGFSDEVMTSYGDLSEQVKMISDKSLQFVKKYPVYSLLGAAAVGIVIGSMIRKKNI